jgi:hypothetical protein
MQGQTAPVAPGTESASSTGGYVAPNESASQQYYNELLKDMPADQALETVRQVNPTFTPSDASIEITGVGVNPDEIPTQVVAPVVAGGGAIAAGGGGGPSAPPATPPSVEPGNPNLVTPPVQPPVQPPVTPPVEPPVQPPVEPPVEPPAEPPAEPPKEPPANIHDYSTPYEGPYSNESVLERFMASTLSYGDIAKLVAAGLVLPSILGMISPSGPSGPFRRFWRWRWRWKRIDNDISFSCKNHFLDLSISFERK